MFSGIVQHLGKISHLDHRKNFLRYAVSLPYHVNLSLGASVSIDGACQTVVKIEKHTVFFEAIQETLKCTILNRYTLGRTVHIERSLRVGDEIGGHFLSGHVYGVATVDRSIRSASHHELMLRCPTEWMKYILLKGFIAINGVSLTVVAVDPNGKFSVHLIPETLKRTTLGRQEEGDCVNIELDTQTQAIVDTVERLSKIDKKNKRL